MGALFARKLFWAKARRRRGKAEQQLRMKGEKKGLLNYALGYVCIFPFLACGDRRMLSSMTVAEAVSLK